MIFTFNYCRLGTDEELEEEEETEEGKEKKKIWQADAAVKWGHDKFLELDQEPKSKAGFINL